ncbi:MAG: hypothetical protein ABFD66_10035 [Smithella sp.]
MKKVFMILVSLILIIGIFVAEGGSIRILLCISSFIPIYLGTMASCAFTFSRSEISRAFKHAFTEITIPEKLDIYKQDLQVIRFLSSNIIYWAVTIVILALIGILANVSNPSELGPKVAITCTALLYGFTTRTVLLMPMESSLNKKISDIHA